MKDYHVHSNFSDDCSKHPLLVACETAIGLGIDEIAFTEHVDIDYPAEKGDFQLDYAAYTKEIDKARNLYPQLTILKGLELGMQAHISQKMVKYLNSHSFDFVLGSIHTVEKKELHNGDYTRGKVQQKAYLGYFEELLSTLEGFTEINILAHFDLIKRYGDYQKPLENYEEFLEVIDEIFKIIVAKGIGLEINTSGRRYGIDDFIPGVEVLKRYRENGGEIITFGSDAHRPEHLAFNFEKAYQMAKSIGFKYYTYYRQGKPQYAVIP